MTTPTARPTVTVIPGDGVGPECVNAAIEIITAEKLGTVLLGQVPLIAAIREGGDSGTPIVVSQPESIAGHTFRDIAGDLLVRLAKPATPPM